jgi:hypothetical protein
MRGWIGDAIPMSPKRDANSPELQADASALIAIPARSHADPRSSSSCLRTPYDLGILANIPPFLR